ncbi:beta-1,3-galactosyltransferase 5-like [Bacillus rossius redtenbacheri]|uniref:beta-1,3-galactosyltransferase 5-like n=1 Tax=Bacillus rossius redtenbacheri TaxID=93214 RepID=UPI002FDD478E
MLAVVFASKRAPAAVTSRQLCRQVGMLCAAGSSRIDRAAGSRPGGLTGSAGRVILGQGTYPSQDGESSESTTGEVGGSDAGMVNDALDYMNSLNDSDITDNSDEEYDLCQLPPEENERLTDNEDIDDNNLGEVEPTDVCGQVADEPGSVSVIRVSWHCRRAVPEERVSSDMAGTWVRTAVLLSCLVAGRRAGDASYDYEGPPLAPLYDAGFDLSSGACAARDPRLLVVVHSERSRREARDAVRLTWGTASLARDVALVFLVGRARDHASSHDVAAEAQLYGDVVASRNVDSFDNLTLKAVATAEWVARECPRARFVLKVDDDVFLNVPRLLRLLELPRVSSASRAMFGQLMEDNKPIRHPDSKFFVPEVAFPSGRYPPYLQGGAFIFTGDLASDLHAAALASAFFRVEDLFFTAFLARRVRAGVTHVEGFLAEKWWRGGEWRQHEYVCDLQRRVAVHPADYQAMFEMWVMAFRQVAC